MCMAAQLELAIQAFRRRSNSMAGQNRLVIMDSEPNQYLLSILYYYTIYISILSALALCRNFVSYEIKQSIKARMQLRMQQAFCSLACSATSYYVRKNIAVLTFNLLEYENIYNIFVTLCVFIQPLIRYIDGSLLVMGM